jgi:alkanesulfonate monooxygenase SsuD/methylene tetrahydromethanopterin reductase-like flavin-dependent oxidoreductase (luciferase family)
VVSSYCDSKQSEYFGKFAAAPPAVFKGCRVRKAKRYGMFRRYVREIPPVWERDFTGLFYREPLCSVVVMSAIQHDFLTFCVKFRAGAASAAASGEPGFSGSLPE